MARSLTTGASSAPPSAASRAFSNPSAASKWSARTPSAPPPEVSRARRAASPPASRAARRVSSPPSLLSRAWNSRVARSRSSFSSASRASAALRRDAGVLEAAAGLGEALVRLGLEVAGGLHRGAPLGELQLGAPLALLDLGEGEAEAVDEEGGLALAVRRLARAGGGGEEVAAGGLAAGHRVALVAGGGGERLGGLPRSRLGGGELFQGLGQELLGLRRLLDGGDVVFLGLGALRGDELLAGLGLLGLAGGGGDGGLGREERLARHGEGVGPLAADPLDLLVGVPGLLEGGVEAARLGEGVPFRVGRRLQRRLGGGHGRDEPLGLQAEELLLQPREDVGLLLPAGRARGLPLERRAGAVDLRDDVGQAEEVRPRLLELHLGLLLADLVLRDPRGLLDEAPAVLRLGREDEVDLLLLDDGVGADAEAGPEEEVLDVLQAGLAAVDDVVARAVARDAAGEDDLAARVGPLAAPRLEGERDLGHAEGPAPGGAVEDDVFHRRAAQGAGRLLAEDPHDGVADVRLAGAVRPDDGGQPGGKGERGPFDERLEPLDFELLQAKHGYVRRATLPRRRGVVPKRGWPRRLLRRRASWAIRERRGGRAGARRARRRRAS